MKNLLKPFLIWVFIMVCVFQLKLTAQGFIVHSSFSDDDGNPAKDSDGVPNNEVIWSGGGTVHIVTWGYYVQKDQTLEIKPGAIVKIASEFLLDTSGNLSSWKPGGFIDFRSGATFLANQVIITDIRDDTEGGDINLDGSSSSPPNFGTSAADYYTLYFADLGGGSINGYIKNCTVKYATLYGRIPVTTDNNFLVFNEWSFVNAFYLPDPLLVPVVSHNIFEFATTKSRLYFLGASPIITGNTFRYTTDAQAPSYNQAAIIIGPAAQGDNKMILPTSGTTNISDNLFETGGGIAINSYSIPDQNLDDALTQFNLVIRHNTFRGVALPGESSTIGRTCLTLDLRAHVEVIDNKFSNYVKFLDWRAGSSSAYGGLKINNNYFERGSILGQFAPYSLDKFWMNGIFINAENNYWCDPSGPNDYSDADGLQNQRGKGIALVDGWDYVPFIGGTTPPSKDAIHINAIHSVYPLPMLPGTSPTVDVNVDNYKLESANTGKITVLIRDAEGYILNQPGTVVSVTSQNTSVSIPAIQFNVPELSPLITVEALLMPDGDLPETTSNVESFVVKLPASSLSISSIKGVAYNGIVPGNESKPTISLNYTLVTSSPTTNGTIEFELIEVGIDYHNVINTYPLIIVSVPSGTKKSLDKEITINIPLIDAKNEDFARRILALFLKLKDDKGVEVGSANKVIKINDMANYFGNFIMVPAIDIGNGQLVEAGREHFLVGETPGFIVYFSVNIMTENIKNWQVWISPTVYTDKDYITVLNIYQLNPAADQLSTGFTQKKALIGLETIPAGVVAIRSHFKLDSPDPHITVREEFWKNFDVRQATQVSQKIIPQGMSQISFNPIPASLNFSANQNTGTAFAEEFTGQFSSSSAKVNQNQLMKSTVAWYWELIPLNKYWSVYDTLKEGTFSATISFIYNPVTDFPNVPGFNEDSLVIAGLNPLSGELEALPSILDKSTHTITTEYTKFFDTWVVASKATVITTVKSPPTVQLPEQFSLQQNYPNPFNPSTIISWQLPLGSQATLKVYDILGREVATLVNEYKPAGKYETEFSAKGGQKSGILNLTSGIYFYRLQAGSYLQTKKMILLR